jgi:hypothetical protein
MEMSDSLTLCKIGVVAAYTGMTMISQAGGVPTNFLEYGALGLVGLMIWLNWKDKKALTDSLASREKRMEELVENAVAAINRLCDRPCMAKKDPSPKNP